MDAVQQANSGHPGAPMGLADVGEVLWREVLRAQSRQSALVQPRPFCVVEWPRVDVPVRDAALVGLCGVDRRHQTLSSTAFENRRPSRTWRMSRCRNDDRPARQGIANGVGFAIAERELARTFNRPGYDVIDHRTWVVCRRRLPDGRHFARSRFARRHAGSGQTQTHLRRQRHLDRRRDERLVHRRCAARASKRTAGT